MFLDTSFCIDLFREQKRNEEGPATRKLKSLGEAPLYVSIFVICELHAGARLSKKSETELHKVELFSEFVEIVYPDRSFAVVYGETEAHLRREGRAIPTMDLLIGVSAKQYGLPILTRNRKHFKQIPDLIIENYSST